MRLPWMVLPFVFFTTVGRSWPGYDWERWQAVSREDRPAIQSPQAGNPELVPLLEPDEPETGNIASLEAWRRKQARLRETILALLGEPTDLKPAPAEERYLGEVSAGDHVRRRLWIRSEPDDWIPAWVLLPNRLPSARLPVMIVIHQTSRQGKDEPCGVEEIAPSNPELRIGVELVGRGYAVLAPDMIGFGERLAGGDQPYDGIMKFFERHPHWSVFGKTVWDAGRMLDWIETQPWADPGRVGVIGHSHGAYSSIISAAFEPRIRAVVASCGFTTFRADPRPDRWSHLTPLMPRLGFFVGDIKAAPTDWHEIIALISPRAFFNWQPLQDDNFQNTENLASIFDDLREINRMSGRLPESIRLMQASGPHAFPATAREAAYDWLDKTLNHQREN